MRLSTIPATMSAFLAVCIKADWGVLLPLEGDHRQARLRPTVYFDRSWAQLALLHIESKTRTSAFIGRVFFYRSDSKSSLMKLYDTPALLAAIPAFLMVCIETSRVTSTFQRRSQTSRPKSGSIWYVWMVYFTPSRDSLDYSTLKVKRWHPRLSPSWNH